MSDANKRAAKIIEIERQIQDIEGRLPDMKEARRVAVEALPEHDRLIAARETIKELRAKLAEAMQDSGQLIMELGA